MLRTSTRNVAYEVISCLIENGKGVLTEIIKFLSTTTNRHFVQEENSFFLDSLQKKNSYGKHYNAQLYPRPNIKAAGPNDPVFINKNEAESGEEEETDFYMANHPISKLGIKNSSNLSLGVNQNNDEPYLKLRRQSVETSQTNLHVSNASQLASQKQVIRQRVVPKNHDLGKDTLVESQGLVTRSDFGSNMKSNTEDIDEDANLIFQPKEISAFDQSLANIRTSPDQIQQVLSPLAKTIDNLTHSQKQLARDASSENNGTDFSKQISDFTNEGITIIGSSNQLELQNEIGNGLLTAMNPKQVLEEVSQVKSPLEFEGQGRGRLGTGEKVQTITIARSEKRNSQAVNAGQNVIAPAQQLSALKKQIKIQQPGANNIRRNI